MKSVKETDNENKFDKSLQLIEEGSGINDSSFSMDLEDVQTKMERIIKMKKAFCSIAYKGEAFSLEKVSDFINKFTVLLRRNLNVFVYERIKNNCNIINKRDDNQNQNIITENKVKKKEESKLTLIDD